MRVASNDGGVLGIEYDWLGNGDASPPNSNYSFDSYDLWVNFQDGSTGGATSWSWTFGDGQNGTGSSVRHRYQTPGSYSACLMASNSGGADPTPFCTTVVVSTVPSVTVLSNGGLGLDGDALDDLAISSTGCTPIPKRLIAMLGAQTAQLSKDYRQISIADMGSAVFVDGDACVGGALLDEYRDYRSGFLVRSTGGFTYRMWIADSTAQGARFRYDLIASPQIFSSSFE
jgi:PKD repeat protein